MVSTIEKTMLINVQPHVTNRSRDPSEAQSGTRMTSFHIHIRSSQIAALTSALNSYTQRSDVLIYFLSH